MAHSPQKWRKWLECDIDAKHMMEASYLSADRPLQFIVTKERPTEDDSGHPVIAGSTATITNPRPSSLGQIHVRGKLSIF